MSVGAAVAVVALGVAAAWRVARRLASRAGRPGPRVPRPRVADPAARLPSLPGFEVVRGRDGESLRGRIDGFPVRVSPLPEGRFRVVVDGDGSWPRGVDVALREATSSVRGVTGDPEFDTLAVARGRDSHVLGLLGRAERERLPELMLRMAELSGSRSVGVREGSVVADLAGRAPEAVLMQLVATMAECARDLGRGGTSPVGRLRKNARKDPVAAVRARCLRAIADPKTAVNPIRRAESLRRGLADPDAAVRLAAAVGLGKEGARLVALIASDPAVPSGVRVAAMAALRRPTEAMWRALPGLVAAEASGKDVLEIASKAGPAAEPALIALLGRSEDEDRVAAIRLLAKWGGVGAIPSLARLAGRGRQSGAPLAQAARAAVEAIRSRLGDVDAGRLALVEGDGGGELSAAASTGEGSVSLARDGGDLSAAPSGEGT